MVQAKARPVTSDSSLARALADLVEGQRSISLWCRALEQAALWEDHRLRKLLDAWLIVASSTHRNQGRQNEGQLERDSAAPVHFGVSSVVAGCAAGEAEMQGASSRSKVQDIPARLQKYAKAHVVNQPLPDAPSLSIPQMDDTEEVKDVRGSQPSVSEMPARLLKYSKDKVQADVRSAPPRSAKETEPPAAPEGSAPATPKSPRQIAHEDYQSRMEAQKSQINALLAKRLTMNAELQRQAELSEKFAEKLAKEEEAREKEADARKRSLELYEVKLQKLQSEAAAKQSHQSVGVKAPSGTRGLTTATSSDSDLDNILARLQDNSREQIEVAVSPRGLIEVAVSPRGLKPSNESPAVPESTQLGSLQYKSHTGRVGDGDVAPPALGHQLQMGAMSSSAEDLDHTSCATSPDMDRTEPPDRKTHSLFLHSSESQRQHGTPKSPHESGANSSMHGSTAGSPEALEDGSENMSGIGRGQSLNSGPSTSAVGINKDGGATTALLDGDSCPGNMQMLEEGAAAASKTECCPSPGTKEWLYSLHSKSLVQQGTSDRPGSLQKDDQCGASGTLEGSGAVIYGTGPCSWPDVDVHSSEFQNHTFQQHSWQMGSLLQSYTDPGTAAQRAGCSPSSEIASSMRLKSPGFQFQHSKQSSMHDNVMGESQESHQDSTTTGGDERDLNDSKQPVILHGSTFPIHVGHPLDGTAPFVGTSSDKHELDDTLRNSSHPGSTVPHAGSNLTRTCDEQKPRDDLHKGIFGSIDEDCGPAESAGAGSAPLSSSEPQEASYTRCSLYKRILGNTSEALRDRTVVPNPISGKAVQSSIFRTIQSHHQHDDDTHMLGNTADALRDRIFVAPNKENHPVDNSFIFKPPKSNHQHDGDSFKHGIHLSIPTDIEEAAFAMLPKDDFARGEKGNHDFPSNARRPYRQDNPDSCQQDLPPKGLQSHLGKIQSSTDSKLTGNTSNDIEDLAWQELQNYLACESFATASSELPSEIHQLSTANTSPHDWEAYVERAVRKGLVRGHAVAGKLESLMKLLHEGRQSMRKADKPRDQKHAGQSEWSELNGARTHAAGGGRRASESHISWLNEFTQPFGEGVSNKVPTPATKHMLDDSTDSEAEWPSTFAYPLTQASTDVGDGSEKEMDTLCDDVPNLYKSSTDVCNSSSPAQDVGSKSEHLHRLSALLSRSQGRSLQMHCWSAWRTYCMQVVELAAMPEPCCSSALEVLTSHEEVHEAVEEVPQTQSHEITLPEDSLSLDEDEFQSILKNVSHSIRNSLGDSAGAAKDSEHEGRPYSAPSEDALSFDEDAAQVGVRKVSDFSGALSNDSEGRATVDVVPRGQSDSIALGVDAGHAFARERNSSGVSGDPSSNGTAGKLLAQSPCHDTAAIDEPRPLVEIPVHGSAEKVSSALSDVYNESAAHAADVVSKLQSDTVPVVQVPPVSEEDQVAESAKKILGHSGDLSSYGTDHALSQLLLEVHLHGMAATDGSTPLDEGPVPGIVTKGSNFSDASPNDLAARAAIKIAQESQSDGIPVSKDSRPLDDDDAPENARKAYNLSGDSSSSGIDHAAFKVLPGRQCHGADIALPSPLDGVGVPGMGKKTSSNDEAGLAATDMAHRLQSDGIPVGTGSALLDEDHTQSDSIPVGKDSALLDEDHAHQNVRKACKLSGDSSKEGIGHTEFTMLPQTQDHGTDMEDPRPLDIAPFLDTMKKASSLLGDVTVDPAAHPIDAEVPKLQFDNIPVGDDSAFSEKDRVADSVTTVLGFPGDLSSNDKDHLASEVLPKVHHHGMPAAEGHNSLDEGLVHGIVQTNLRSSGASFNANAGHAPVKEVPESQSAGIDDSEDSGFVDWNHAVESAGKASSLSGDLSGDGMGHVVDDQKSLGEGLVHSIAQNVSSVSGFVSDDSARLAAVEVVPQVGSDVILVGKDSAIFDGDHVHEHERKSSGLFVEWSGDCMGQGWADPKLSDEGPVLEIAKRASSHSGSVSNGGAGLERVEVVHQVQSDDSMGHLDSKMLAFGAMLPMQSPRDIPVPDDSTLSDNDCGRSNLRETSGFTGNAAIAEVPTLEFHYAPACASSIIFDADPSSTASGRSQLESYPLPDSDGLVPQDVTEVLLASRSLGAISYNKAIWDDAPSTPGCVRYMPTFLSNMPAQNTGLELDEVASPACSKLQVAHDIQQQLPPSRKLDALSWSTLKPYSNCSLLSWVMLPWALLVCGRRRSPCLNGFNLGSLVTWLFAWTAFHLWRICADHCNGESNANGDIFNLVMLSKNVYMMLQASPLRGQLARCTVSVHRAALTRSACHCRLQWATGLWRDDATFHLAPRLLFLVRIAFRAWAAEASRANSWTSYRGRSQSARLAYIRSEPRSVSDALLVTSACLAWREYVTTSLMKTHVSVLRQEVRRTWARIVSAHRRFSARHEISMLHRCFNAWCSLRFAGDAKGSVDNFCLYGDGSSLLGKLPDTPSPPLAARYRELHLRRVEMLGHQLQRKASRSTITLAFLVWLSGVTVTGSKKAPNGDIVLESGTSSPKKQDLPSTVRSKVWLLTLTLLQWALHSRRKSVALEHCSQSAAVHSLMDWRDVRLSFLGWRARTVDRRQASRVGRDLCKPFPLIGHGMSSAGLTSCSHLARCLDGQRLAVLRDAVMLGCKKAGPMLSYSCYDFLVLRVFLRSWLNECHRVKALRGSSGRTLRKKSTVSGRASAAGARRARLAASWMLWAAVASSCTAGLELDMVQSELRRLWSSLAAAQRRLRRQAEMLLMRDCMVQWRRLK